MLEEIKLDIGFGKLVLSINVDSDYKEAAISLEDNNGCCAQDIVLVRPSENVSKTLECLVWTDESSEDYTRRYEVKMYEEMEFNIKTLPAATYTTSLKKEAQWINYEIYNNDGTLLLASWIIIPINETKTNMEAHIMRRIEERGGIKQFPRFDDLNTSVVELIKSCHESDNEMIFIEPNEKDSYDRSAIEADIKKWNLDTYIRFDEDGSYITVYGGISELIDWSVDIA